MVFQNRARPDSSIINASVPYKCFQLGRKLRRTTKEYVMKKLLFIISIFSILILVSQTSQAQIRLGIQGGLSVPELSGGNNVISQGYTSRLAPNFGITADIPVAGNFSIEPQVNFDGQGGQRNGLQPITSTSLPSLPGGGYYYANFRNTSVLNYLEIPVLAEYTFGLGGLSLEINAGPYVGFLLSATQKTSGTSYIYLDANRDPLVMPNGNGGFAPVPPQSFDANTDVSSSINKVNVGIDGGVGLLLPVSSVSDLMLNIRGLYGLTDIQKYSKDGSSHTGNLLVDIGYSYMLPII